MPEQLTQSQLLVEVFKLVVKSGIFPKTRLREWPAVLLYLHKKGFLFVGFEESIPVLVACAYRVKEIPKDYPENYPENEEGNILYIPWMVSFAKDKLLPKRLMDRYMERNHDIEAISLHDHKKDDKPMTYHRQKQEANNG